MKGIFHFYKILNLLSIDVSIGAISSALFFSKILHVTLKPYGFACLFLTVWIIYTADHLADVYPMKTMASTARHKFHQKYFKLLTTLLILACLINVSLLFLIKPKVLYWGLPLAGIVGIYFLIQSKLRFLKEILGAFLYSSGVLLPSLAVTNRPISLFVILLIIQFMTTALINLVLFSWFDYTRDLRDQRSSLVTDLGHRSGNIFLIVLFGVQGIFTCCLIMLQQDLMAALVLAAMNVVLLFIFIKNNYFSRHDRYRYPGDAIFFLPLIYF
jgi:hypothetical protein